MPTPIKNTETKKNEPLTVTPRQMIGAIEKAASDVRSGDRDVAVKLTNVAENLGAILDEEERNAREQGELYAKATSLTAPPNTQAEVEVWSAARTKVLAERAAERTKLATETAEAIAVLSEAVEVARLMATGPLPVRREVSLEDVGQQQAFKNAYAPMPMKRILKQYEVFNRTKPVETVENLEVALTEVIVDRKAMTLAKLGAIAGTSATAQRDEADARHTLERAISANIEARAPEWIASAGRAFAMAEELFRELLGYSVKFVPFGQAWIENTNFYDASRRWAIDPSWPQRFLRPSPHYLPGFKPTTGGVGNPTQGRLSDRRP